jgi:hypothetical protein
VSSLARATNKMTLDGGIDYVRRWGVVEHWALSEASGAAVASISGANSLTAVNAPTSSPGKVYPLARQFTAADGEYFSLADNAATSAGDIDFGIAAWVYLDSKATFRSGITKWGASGQFGYAGPYYSSDTDRFAFFVSSNGTASARVDADALGAPSTGVWHFVLNWHDAVNNTINIRVNHGTVNSVAHAAGIFDNTTAFEIGRRGDGAQPWDGRIQQATLFKSPPGGIAGVIDEISSRLYNGGNGRAYPWR